jgi:hypothetical protein
MTGINRAALERELEKRAAELLDGARIVREGEHA